MQWSSELYHYEVTPPQGSWERINFELDNDISGLRNNLKDFEETPPAAVWTAVTDELDGVAEIKTLPWYSKPSRWVAAASIAAILVFAAWLLNGQKENILPAELATSILPHESAALGTPKKIPTEISLTPPTVSAEKKTTPDKIQTEDPLSSAHIEEISISKNPIVTTSGAGKHVLLARVEMETTPAPVTAPLTIRDNRDYRMMKAVQFHDGNYIRIISPEGTVRLSYKLKDLIPAIRNDVDNATLNQWKSKLESAASIPASVNFFDIGDMVSIMTEQQ